MTEAEITELLKMVKNMKIKKAKPPQRPGSGKSILRHAGKWLGEVQRSPTSLINCIRKR